MTERITSDPVLTWPSGGIVLGGEDVEKIKSEIWRLPGYPVWDESISLVENIMSVIRQTETAVENNYTYDDPYDYSISDTWCERCDGYS